MRGVEEEIIPKEKGLMVLFPSFLLHRVSPVTSGERQS
jgi:predicted 2-oxoglutarate/Fe(II)-dependent dioxygenase YbiX